MADWSTLPRNKDGRWMDDGIPNMVTKKTAEKTDDEKATDQRETAAGNDSDAPSTAGTPTDDTTTTPDAHVPESETGDPKASDSDLPGTGIEGEAFPDRVQPKNSDETVTVENVFGTEYEQPKFRAIYDPSHDSWGVSPYGWVGPEAIIIPARDLDDFKSFVASL